MAIMDWEIKIAVILKMKEMDYLDMLAVRIVFRIAAFTADSLAEVLVCWIFSQQQRKK